jgi:glycosyltransferase involved in cell wall biosynthesis
MTPQPPYTQQSTSANHPDLYVVSQFATAHENSTGYLWALLIHSAQAAGYRVHLITPRADLPGWIPKAMVKLIVTGMLMLACLWRVPRRATVLCATNPAFLPLGLFLLRPFKQIRVFVLIHDLFPQNTLVAGLMQGQSRRYRWLLALFERAYRGMAGLIVIGRDMHAVLREWLGPDVAVLYVANWVPAAQMTAATRLAAHRPAAPPSSLCRFQYFGNLGALQGLEAVLDGIAKSKATNARFDFIGTGAAKAAILSHPVLAKDPRITLHPGVAFADRGGVLGACDVSLVTLRPQMYGLAVPSKAYFSLAHAIPFLYMGDANSELHLTLQDHPDLGWFVPAGDAQALADQIDRLCSAPPNPDIKTRATAFLAPLHPDLALHKIMEFLHR